MPKKTTRTTKSAQQKAREEQWRRRVSAQGLAAVDEFADSSPVEDLEESLDEEIVPAATTRTMSAARSRQPASAMAGRASAVAAQQRRASASATRASRLRPAVASLSMEEEMYYVRSDIRRLIVLTAICLAILIALSFVLR